MMTEPDQYNRNMKMKFRTQEFEAPLFRNICDFESSGMMYGADGQLVSGNGKITTEYTKNSKRNIKDELLDDNFDNKFFPNLNAKKTSNIFNNEEAIEDEATAYHCDKLGKKDKKNVYDGDRYVRCREKSRYIEHNYIPGGSMETGGFGNLDRFSDLKQGIATRNKHDTVSDQRVDDYRFHYTFRDYQSEHIGSYPLPENTRYANKKYIN